LQLGKMLDKTKNKGTPAKYIRNINVRWFSFDLSDLLEMRFTEPEQSKFAITNGDIIICEGGEPGRAAVWTSGTTTLKYQKALHRVRLHSGYNQDWITYQLYYLAKSGKLATYFSGTTIKHLPQEALATVRFVVPPEGVQRKLVKVLNRAFGALDRTLSEVAKATSLVERLNQATLTMAFEGNLG
jgi:type I restriction enzyme S subunit